ncbi:MAG: 2TM domain-containing protein [Burkholderiales bacterium]|nr:2TM domain-containing protein [Burkholderiales bacterium]
MDEKLRIARRNAGMKLGWLMHAAVYVVVNAVLVAANLAIDPAVRWSAFPLAGWGIGLAIHGAAVWIATGGGGLRDRMIRRELERLG